METRSLTYRELADALGVKIDSARKTVQRRRWKKVTGNDGTVRVIVPVDYVDRSMDSPTDSPTLNIRELEVRIEGLKDLLAAETRRAVAAEGDRDAWRATAQVLAERRRGWFGWRLAG